MQRRIKILSTDFDGTLIGHPSDGRCVDSMAGLLREHKAGGGLWVVNTGRSFAHTLEGIARFQPPVQPDFLVVLEREIYCDDAEGEWREHIEWNEQCRQRHHRLFEEVKPLIKEICDHIRESQDVTLISEEGIPAGLVTTSEEVMHRVVEVIEHHARDFPDFSYQRNTIYLRFCHRAYHKGSALAEIARVQNVPPACIMAAGDNYNDISMLDGEHAHMPACPGNSIPEVKRLLAGTGGYIAISPWAEGVVEAYRWFLSEARNIASLKA